MVAFADSACRPRLEALQDGVLRVRRRCCPVDLSSPAAEQVIYRARLVRPARHLRRTLGLTEPSAYRMLLRAPLLEQAAAAAPAGPVRAMVRVDLHHYAEPPGPSNAVRIRWIRGWL